MNVTMYHHTMPWSYTGDGAPGLPATGARLCKATYRCQVSCITYVCVHAWTFTCTIFSSSDLTNYGWYTENDNLHILWESQECTDNSLLLDSGL